MIVKAPLAGYLRRLQCYGAVARSESAVDWDCFDTKSRQPTLFLFFGLSVFNHFLHKTTASCGFG
ncbi:hypothetical protein D3C80_2129010 [compost metagenome]